MRPLIVLAAVIALAGCGSGTNDPRQMAHQLALNSIQCTVPTDCCVVFDGCKGQGLLVSATDSTAAAVLLSEASQTSCVRCLPPPIQVDCVDGLCVAQELVSDGTATTDPLTASQDHCGTVTLPAGWSVKGSSASVRGDLAPATIIGCGD